MPAVTQNPTTVKTETVNADQWTISGIHIFLPTTEARPEIHLEISYGEGEFSHTDRHVVRDEHEWVDNDSENPMAGQTEQLVAGQDYFTQLVSRSTSGLSIYAELKSLCYEHAVARGWIPAEVEVS